jgi:hypothetical protein
LLGFSRLLHRVGARDWHSGSVRHCWAEFFADGKWVPVDISEGNKNASLADYYFGHHPANRFELSKGRDLVVEPEPDSGPINLLAYPAMEINGKPVRVQTEFLFRPGSRTTSSLEGHYRKWPLDRTLVGKFKADSVQCFSTSFMPHLGQSPGLFCTTSGCIEQVYWTVLSLF